MSNDGNHKIPQPEITKGKSPFYPGQPVPVELFVGRAPQIERIMTRGVGQVIEGKPTAFYVQGEYGIGKSSIAVYVQSIAERHHGLHGIYANLGGAHNLTDVASAVLQATVKSGAFDPKRSEAVRNWLARYVGSPELFGFSLDFEKLKQDAPQISTPFGMLEFLSKAKSRLDHTGAKGIFLILDEIDGIAGNRNFAHFVKGLVETNAISDKPLPLLLMLCGVEERRRELIEKHQPIDRIFDIIDIDPMNQEEMERFFMRAFNSVRISVDPAGMQVLTHYSAGFPKIMHIVGDSAYWIDKDYIIDKTDAGAAVVQAANEVGAKFVDQQVYKALRSADYRAILAKLALMGPSSQVFTRKKLAADLTDGEKRKLNNFLQKMKELRVIRSGDNRGDYIFNMRMVQFYIWLQNFSSWLEKTVGSVPVENEGDKH